VPDFPLATPPLLSPVWEKGQAATTRSYPDLVRRADVHCAMCQRGWGNGHKAQRTVLPLGLVGISSGPLDSRQGPLQNNGGPTQTDALLPGSPAIGKADSSKALATDERGHPRNLKKPTDIGAFET
jgi:hypothetical protein